MKRLVAAVLLGLGSTVPAAADEPFHCVLKEAGGVSAAEAGTAVGLICDDLRRESGGRGAFEIRLGTLGSLVNVTATRLDTGESMAGPEASKRSPSPRTSRWPRGKARRSRSGRSGIPPGSAPQVYPAQSRYVVPVSIGISVAF